jgi:hypothetical protein
MIAGPKGQHIEGRTHHRAANPIENMNGSLRRVALVTPDFASWSNSLLFNP